MNPKSRAIEMYKEAYQRWCFEPSHDKNHLAAKAMVEWAIKYILPVIDSSTVYEECKELEKEVKKLRHSDAFKI